MWGIGAVLQNDKDGGAKIVQLYEGGSGEQAGLKKWRCSETP